MPIDLILTGGTICSRVDSDGTRRSFAEEALTSLEARYRADNPYAEVRFRVHRPLDKLSEDLTPDDWCLLLREIARVDSADSEGILIAHGTDTLEQTAAMLSAALCGISLPVLLVSATAPLDDPRSNGHRNFAEAVRLIRRGLCGGVWAVFENSDGVVYLHYGFELSACAHGSMSFESPRMTPVSQLRQTAESGELPPRRGMPLALSDIGEPKNVLLLRPYNGLRYDTVSLESVEAVVHTTYHSETANSERYSPYGMQTLISRCAERGIPCFLAPCSDAPVYGSGHDLVQAGAIPLAGMTPAFAYGAVWFCLMRGVGREALAGRVRGLRQRLSAQCLRCAR